MDMAVVFATNVKNILKKRRITMKQLSESSGISLPFLNKTLNHCRNISLEKIAQIATALNVPFEILFEHDWDEETCLKAGLEYPQLPNGYEHVCVVLDRFKAYRVKEWDREIREKLNLPKKN